MSKLTWISNSDDWNQFRNVWPQIAGASPCRQFDWLYQWWRQYGAGKQLMIGAVFAPLTLAGQDSDATTHNKRESLVAALPCFWQRTRQGGRTLQLLGSGATCSDFVGLLSRPGFQLVATEALSQGLAQREMILADGRSLRWDQIDFDGVAAADLTTRGLITRLEMDDCPRRTSSKASTWRLPVAPTFDEQISICGKSLRRKLRNLNRRFWETGKAVLRFAESEEQREYGQQLLIELHQKRRTALGEPGCFADDRFKQFYLDASDALWKKDQWEVQWMEVDGAPVAAQTGCWMNGTFYMYQSGYDPAFESIEPGWMMNVGTLRRAIDERWKAIDFMRGDERYKSMLRATPTPCLREQLCHSAWDSRTRFAAVGFAQQAKRWWGEKSQTAVSD